MMLPSITNNHLSLIIWLGVLYNCRGYTTNVVDSLQINLFMQNKAKFRKSQMNISNLITKYYDKKDTWWDGKKQSQTNPNKPKFKKAKMNVTSIITKGYENKPPILAPKKQSQISKRQKPMQTSLPQRIMKKTAFSGSDKTNPNKPNLSRRSLWRRRNQTQFLSAISVAGRRQKMLPRLKTNTRPNPLGHYADWRLFAGEIPNRRKEFLAANYEVRLDFYLKYV